MLNDSIYVPGQILYSIIFQLNIEFVTGNLCPTRNINRILLDKIKDKSSHRVMIQWGQCLDDIIVFLYLSRELRQYFFYFVGLKKLECIRIARTELSVRNKEREHVWALLKSLYHFHLGFVHIYRTFYSILVICRVKS